ncbi:LL-diaminopimelate aminotransferase [Hydrogenispora ethanolica]|uniref:Aminotransferase n=1 Tax=Hydrogenispora ethanolica TaxID=1082276 RepID=A0A4R1R9R1_HYDET|nr:LL-diaminopimelate aminotransferase [Hydrogenispora ethanolica]TCL62425.1 LL-diaminopimelate aminotransferase [Hydrogenispora ethanolica]
MDFIDDKIAERLGGRNFGKSTTVYKFVRIKQAKQEARASKPFLPLIDMGVGEPDRPADPRLVAVLAEEAGKPENRWYSDNGIGEFQDAAAGYMDRVYGVKNLTRANIIHGIGSKPILAMLPLCLVNPGEIALTTFPGYPVTATYTRYLGGDTYHLPLLPENQFYPDFSAIPAPVLKKAKLLYINYPNNPTGQVATREFYQSVVRFARQNNIFVISDAAYAALTFDGYQPLSFLAVDGAMDVGVEVHSLSKAFNMTGWRLAFVAGHPRIIQAYGTVKDNTDSGQFRAIQKAGIYALQHPELTAANCERYSRRHNLLVAALRELGFAAHKPRGSFYCYVPAPKGTRSGLVFENAEAAAEYLIKEALISTVPWDDAGAYLRFSVTFEADGDEAEKRVIAAVRERLGRLELVF